MESPHAANPAGLPVLQIDPEWAWTAYRPSGEYPWTRALAAHLHRRAGFGASWPMLERTLGLGPKAAVDEMMECVSPATGAESRFGEWMEAAARSGNGETYVAWWLRRLLESRAALWERLTLFWHGHLALDLDAVGDLPLFHRHLEILRARSLGGLREWLSAQFEDPAVWVALGGSQNRRSQPNAALARRWLAALTAGAEPTSETVSLEFARALTGWFVYGDRLRWIEREHDSGEKRILGHAGRFGREDVVRILAEHPATARKAAVGLFRCFVSETSEPSAALLAPLQACLGRGGGILSCVERILRSNLFYSRHAVGQRVKSPVELMIGLARAFDTLLPTQSMAQDLARFGQRLDAPPTLEGWTGGTDWINSMTIGARQKACLGALNGEEGYGKGFEPWRLAQTYGCQSEAEARQLWAALLLPGATEPRALGATPSGARAAEPEADPVRVWVKRCLLDPRFQLG